MFQLHAEHQQKIIDEAGKEFDERFIKMMQSGLEDDIKLFEKANDLDDEGVNELIKKYLPQIRASLDLVKSLDDD